MICETILDALGNTPMIRLQHMTGPEDAEIIVKFEGLNVGGSIKTRTAYNMIADAEKRGLIKPDTIIVEPTSGNQGIGLALVGAVAGLLINRDYSVWDYRQMPLNFLGQICLPFSLLWIPVSLGAMMLYRLVDGKRCS